MIRLGLSLLMFCCESVESCYTVLYVQLCAQNLKMKASIDPVKRDGKALTFSDSSVVVHFLFCVLILLPLWIVVLLPLAILSLGFSKLFSKPVVKESDSQSEIVEEFKREVPGSKV